MEDGFKQFKQNASSFFNRTIQKTEEAFKTTEKTPLDPHLEDLIKQCETRQAWATSLIAHVEAVIQPNLANRMEDMVLKGLDRKKERVPIEEQFGESLVSIGKTLATTPNGTAMVKCGQAQSIIGKATRTLQDGIESSYLTWLREFLNNSARVAQRERENLDNTRLDLDRAKTRLKRAKDDAAKKQICEQQVTEQQTLFDRQCDKTRQVLERCVSDFDGHKEALTRLLNAQRQFYESCLDAVEKALQ